MSVDPKKKPLFIGGKNAHEVLLRELGRKAPAKVLDVPSGLGGVAYFLRDRGWDVSCADVDPGLLEPGTFPFSKVNLNRDPLPYPPESFDVVVCANGLHRLFNPGHAIVQFQRVLKPGGRLYLNFNNYASIYKRLRFLLYGSITNSINEARFLQTVSDPEANFRAPLFYPQVANLLEAAGFRIVEVKCSTVRWSHRLLTPVAWLIRFAALFTSPRTAKRSHIRVTRSSAILPGGKYLYIEAVRI